MELKATVGASAGARSLSVFEGLNHLDIEREAKPDQERLSEQARWRQWLRDLCCRIGWHDVVLDAVDQLEPRRGTYVHCRRCLLPGFAFRGEGGRVRWAPR